MSGHIIPLNASSRTALTHSTPSAMPQRWGEPPPSSPPPPPAQKLQRHLAVLARFKWLILLVTVLGTAAGIVATRFVEPSYVVDASIWIASEAPLTSGGNAGPAQASALVAAEAWTGIFRSGVVSDEVARQMKLFVTWSEPADSMLFRDFDVMPRMRPGTFELRVDAAGRNYQLLLDGQQPVETGAVGDSIGVDLGYLWRPDTRLLTPGRTVAFTVVNPREAGIELNNQLTATLNQNLLRLSLEGKDPDRTQQALDLWIVRFVEVARDLKQSKLADFANQQVVNLTHAERELRAAESALQEFKVGTITQPMEGTPIAAGTAETQSTVVGLYQGQRIQLNNLRASREELERVLNNTRRTGTISEADLFSLTVVPEAAGNPALSGSIAQLMEEQSNRRAALAVYQDSALPVRAIDESIERLQNRTIPGQLQSLITTLRSREGDLERRMASAETEIRQIPERSIREAQLARDVQIRENLASNLSVRAQAAQLAAESATPDVSVLDPPVTPLRPSKNTVPQILAAAVLGSLAVAVLIAFLIDKVDQRFRYPEQAKDDLGLDILGAVPRLRSAPKGIADEEEANHVLEAFRTVRQNVRQALDEGGPVVLTISSPSAGDGKSLVASNLAVSFAEAGHRVLLVDGDIRRGSLHAAFAAQQRPGLADVLSGAAGRKDALRPTSHRNLTLMPCGKRNRQAPELLASAAMVELLGQLRASYDVIVVDSPPLSAGIDAFALGAATGSMAIVLRVGKTNMRLAHAKLGELDRHPIFAMGAVLNGITPKGIYEYYSYGYGYAAEDEEPETPEESEAESMVALPTTGSPRLAGESDLEPSGRS